MNNAANKMEQEMEAEKSFALSPPADCHLTKTRNILLFISYDGTDFFGWQRQDAVRCTGSASASFPRGKKESAFRTVQGVLERALSLLHKCPTPVCGSGRTDSGVHALTQAVTFISPIDSIPVDRYPRAINSFLPGDVRVTMAKEVPQGFSARFNATSRVYRYFINTDNNPAAIIPRYAWCIRRKLNLELLNAFAGELQGEIDCASFAAADNALDDPLDSGGQEPKTSRSTCRYINGMRFFRQDAFPSGSFVVFEIEANAFLYHMVRNLTGTLLRLERQNALPGSLAAVAAAKDRKKAGPTAPPHGLFLWDVKFDGVRRHL